jgi:hypothetical protein
MLRIRYRSVANRCDDGRSRHFENHAAIAGIPEGSSDLRRHALRVFGRELIVPLYGRWQLVSFGHSRVAASLNRAFTR